MNLGIHPFRAALAVAAAGCLIAGVAQPATAAPPDSVPSGVPQLEALDRGLVAVSTSEGVFLSWRLLASEATGATDTGLAGPDFAVYRDGEQVAVVTDSTNYADAAGTATAQYTVAPVVNGIELEASAPVSAWAQGYTDLPLQKPADGITPPTVIPNGQPYTYSANDVSVGDVDGDGAYEYVVKWDPSNSKDVSQRGWTGPVYIDTYELDGTLLNRLDLGVNIRAGAHYTQFLVYDFDGDGRSETMLKTAPGTKSITYNADGTVASEQYITMPEEDLEAGYAQTDDYRMSAADYQDHLVEMFQGWTEHPEVVAGNWPATLEQAWGIPVTHEYPLSSRAPRSSPTTSSTSTRRAEAATTGCASSRASSSTVPSTSRCSTARPARSSRPSPTSPVATTTACSGATTRWRASSRATGSTGSSRASGTSTASTRRRCSPAATTRARRSPRTTGTAST